MKVDWNKIGPQLLATIKAGAMYNLKEGKCFCGLYDLGVHSPNCANKRFLIAAAEGKPITRKQSAISGRK